MFPIFKFITSILLFLPYLRRTFYLHVVQSLLLLVSSTLVTCITLLSQIVEMPVETLFVRILFIKILITKKIIQSAP